MVDLGTLPGWTNSEATAVSNGQIVAMRTPAVLRATPSAGHRRRGWWTWARSRLDEQRGHRRQQRGRSWLRIQREFGLSRNPLDAYGERLLSVSHKLCSPGRRHMRGVPLGRRRNL